MWANLPLHMPEKRHRGLRANMPGACVNFATGLGTTSDHTKTALALRQTIVCPQTQTPPQNHAGETRQAKQGRWRHGEMDTPVRAVAHLLTFHITSLANRQCSMSAIYMTKARAGETSWATCAPCAPYATRAQKTLRQVRLPRSSLWPKSAKEAQIHKSPFWGGWRESSGCVAR